VQKPSGELVGIRVNELSAEDREFLRDWQAQRQPPVPAATEPTQAPADVPSAAVTDTRAVERVQLWTARDGVQLKGRAVGFGRDEIVIDRVTRLISVNGTAFTNLDPASQYVVLKIVAELDDPNVKTERDLDHWVRRQQGEPRVFSIEGVRMRLEDGTAVTVPFFVFSEQDLEVLRPGWEQWQDEQASAAERERQDFLMTVQADQYQSQREQEQLEQARRFQQIQMMQTELMAAATGLTTFWEVYLLPAPGRFGRPLSVMVSARTSLQAQQMATARFPGYVAGPARALTP
jgi:hypothetical protein